MINQFMYLAVVVRPLDRIFSIIWRSVASTFLWIHSFNHIPIFKEMMESNISKNTQNFHFWGRVVFFLSVMKVMSGLQKLTISLV